jgi:carboxymethylenebutenolidase
MTSIATDRTFEIGGVPHYLARSVTPSTAGVLLLPHVYGADEFCRDFADELAGRGLTTLVWHPYPELGLGEPFGAERPPRRNDEAVMKILTDCIDAMHGKLGLTRFATLGFCMGARYSLLFGAREARLSAAVACYPSIPAKRSPGQDLEPLPAASQISCPVHVAYPGRDAVTPRPVFEALRDLLYGREAETTILFYPEAEHGFMHAKGEANAAATKTARPQVLAYLDTYLGG